MIFYLNQFLTYEAQMLKVQIVGQKSSTLLNAQHSDIISHLQVQISNQ